MFSPRPRFRLSPEQQLSVPFIVGSFVAVPIDFVEHSPAFKASARRAVSKCVVLKTRCSRVDVQWDSHEGNLMLAAFRRGQRVDLIQPC
jgi:hypothetical protein